MPADGAPPSLTPNPHRAPTRRNASGFSPNPRIPAEPEVENPWLDEDPRVRGALQRTSSGGRGRRGASRHPGIQASVPAATGPPCQPPRRPRQRPVSVPGWNKKSPRIADLVTAADVALITTRGSSSSARLRRPPRSPPSPGCVRLRQGVPVPRRAGPDPGGRRPHRSAVESGAGGVVRRRPGQSRPRDPRGRRRDRRVLGEDRGGRVLADEGREGLRHGRAAGHRRESHRRSHRGRRAGGRGGRVAPLRHAAASQCPATRALA